MEGKKIELNKFVLTNTIKLFNVLDQLKQQKNFNSYFACVSGVNSCAITRLNWPRGAYRERLSSLSEFTDVEKNFVNYREKLKTCNAPCLPYIGLIKRDLYQVLFYCFIWKIYPC